METFWYAAVAGMLAVYVVLDGLDFGVGMLHLLMARTDTERKTVLATIKPVWDGYEVWLIGAAALLFFAFPRAYAAGFSGFYLALILVLWLFVGRALAVEVRSHVGHPLWRQLWDWVFTGTSGLLAFVFGVALGNLIRGVPLNHEGYFFVALWTDFLPHERPGILDWYTVLMGLTSVAILMLHGANYLAMKTEGELAGRADRLGRRYGWIALGLTLAALLAIPVVQPGLRLAYDARPAGYAFPATGLLALAATLFLRRRQHETAALAASSLFILALLGSVAWGMYPNILISTLDQAHNLTVFNSTAGAYGLRVGLWWFLIGIALMIAYQIFVHVAFRGKVRPDPDPH